MAAVLLFLYLTLTLAELSLAECQTEWKLINSKEYCLGTSELNFEETRKFCQNLDADLPVLDSKTRYEDLVRLLNETSMYEDESIIDIFIGVYHKQCITNVDKDCGWLQPYSGQWYWIDSNTQITTDSNRYWQVLELSLPYITAPHNISVQDLNKQHIMLGSDGKTFALDGFNADEQTLERLLPLCVRNLQVRADKTVNDPNGATGVGGQFLVYLILVSCLLTVRIY